MMRIVCCRPMCIQWGISKATTPGYRPMMRIVCCWPMCTKWGIRVPTTSGEKEADV